MSLAEITTPRRDLVTIERQPRKAQRMGTAIFDKTTKLVTTFVEIGTPDYDSQTHIAIETEVSPELRTKRWDDATGIRDATAQELIDYDAAKTAAEGLAAFDGEQFKLLKAGFLYIAPKLSPPVTPAQLKAGVLAIYEIL